MVFGITTPAMAIEFQALTWTAVTAVILYAVFVRRRLGGLPDDRLGGTAAPGA